jgi:hypothetical protein
MVAKNTNVGDLADGYSMPYLFEFVEMFDLLFSYELCVMIPNARRI